MHDENEADKYQYIAYEPYSFFLNLSTGDICVREGGKK